MGIFYNNHSDNIQLTEGQIMINKLKADPTTVVLALSHESYYLSATDLERFMECADISDVDDAVDTIAGVNDILAEDIVIVDDGCSASLMESIGQSDILMEAVEDAASNVREANKFYKKLLKQAKGKASSRKEIQERINVLKNCVRQMEARKKEFEDNQKNRKTDKDHIKYILKALIPFNDLWRLFKRNDKYAILGTLGSFIIPYTDVAARAGFYAHMLQDNIDATNEAIKFLEEKLKEMK